MPHDCSRLRSTSTSASCRYRTRRALGSSLSMKVSPWLARGQRYVPCGRVPAHLPLIFTSSRSLFSLSHSFWVRFRAPSLVAFVAWLSNLFCCLALATFTSKRPCTIKTSKSVELWLFPSLYLPFLFSRDYPLLCLRLASGRLYLVVPSRTCITSLPRHLHSPAPHCATADNI